MSVLFVLEGYVEDSCVLEAFTAIKLVIITST